MAVQVLMSRSLDFPLDLYFLGADRFGSIIPYLAHIFVLFGISSIWATAIIQYGLLSMSFLLITQIWGRQWRSLLLSIMLLLPIHQWHPQIIVGHVILQFIFFSLLYFWIYIKICEKENKDVLSWIVLLIIAGFIGLWSTEQTAVPFISVSIGLAIHFWRTKQLDWRTILVYFIGVASALFVLSTMKDLVPIPSGLDLHRLEFDADSFRHLGDQFINDLELIKRQPYGPIYALYKVGFAVLILFAWIHLLGAFRLKKLYGPREALPYIIGLSIIGLLIATLGSDWVQNRRFQVRYFIPLAFLNLLLITGIVGSIKKKIWATLVIIVVASSMISSLYHHYKVPYPNFLYNRADIAGQNMLGKASFLGSYWTSYVLASEIHEASIGTPHQDDHIRHEPSLIKVMQSDSIAIVANSWLRNGIPDSLDQFGVRLLRISDDLELGSVKYAFFKKERRLSEIPISDAALNRVDRQGHDSIGKYWTVKSQNTYFYESKHLFLEKGNYTILIEHRKLNGRADLLYMDAIHWAPGSTYDQQEKKLSNVWQKDTLNVHLNEDVGFFRLRLKSDSWSEIDLRPIQIIRNEP